MSSTAVAPHADRECHFWIDSYHRFTPHDDDWGFTYFCSSDRLRTESSSGRQIPVLEDDHVVISVFMKVVKDSTGGGVLWYNLGTGCVLRCYVSGFCD